MTDLNASQLTIRRIELGDAEAVAALSGQLGYESTPEEMRRRIAKLADCEEIQAIFVACIAKDAQLVGWIDVAITYHLQSEPFVLIGGLVVQDGLRGLGIGKRLCEEAEAWTRAKGISIVRRHLAEHSPRRAPFLSARWIHRDQNFQGIRKAPRLN